MSGVGPVSSFARVGTTQRNTSIAVGAAVPGLGWCLPEHTLASPAFELFANSANQGEGFEHHLLS